MRFYSTLRCICAILFALGGSISSASAQEIGERIVSAEIIPGWRNASGQHVAGLKLSLAPGWKTYWRVPGAAGIPPRFRWRGTRNADAIEVLWPTPQVFNQYGTQSIGYHDEVVLPLVMTPKRADAPIKLSGRVEIGVCLDICIPEAFTVSATLPPGGRRTPALIAALADRPFSAQEHGVRAAECTVAPIDGGLSVRAVIDMPSAGAPEAVVIEPADPQLFVSQAKTQRSGRNLIAEAKVYHVDGGVFGLSRNTIRLTVIGASHAVEIEGCASGS